MKAPAWTGLLLTGILLLPGCREAPPPRAEEETEEAAPEVEASPEPRIYERYFAFVGGGEEGTVIVPWLFSASTGGESVRRTSLARLHRNGEWEAFHDDRWTTPRSRAPWRILPRGPARLVVAHGDVVERLVYREGNRRLELRPAPGALAEWTDGGSDSYTVRRATVEIAGEAVDGHLLDIARARRAAAPRPGDWAFLVAGDTLQLALAAPREGAARDSVFLGWMRSGPREFRWDPVEVAWSESRAFEEARRSIPTAWSATATDPELRLTLEAVSSRVIGVESGGPVLPVLAFIAVRGAVRVAADSASVRGVVRHRQP